MSLAPANTTYPFFKYIFESPETFDNEDITLLTINTIASTVYLVSTYKALPIFRKFYTSQRLSAEEKTRGLRLYTISICALTVSQYCTTLFVDKNFNNTEI